MKKLIGKEYDMSNTLNYLNVRVSLPLTRQQVDFYYRKYYSHEKDAI